MKYNKKEFIETMIRSILGDVSIDALKKEVYKISGNAKVLKLKNNDLRLISVANVYKISKMYKIENVSEFLYEIPRITLSVDMITETEGYTRMQPSILLRRIIKEEETLINGVLMKLQKTKTKDSWKKIDIIDTNRDMVIRKKMVDSLFIINFNGNNYVSAYPALKLVILNNKFDNIDNPNEGVFSKIISFNKLNNEIDSIVTSIEGFLKEYKITINDVTFNTDLGDKFTNEFYNVVKSMLERDDEMIKPELKLYLQNAFDLRKSKKLSANDMTVLTFLLMYLKDDEETYVPNVNISKLTALSNKTVSDSINKLISTKMIIKKDIGYILNPDMFTRTFELEK